MTLTGAAATTADIAGMTRRAFADVLGIEEVDDETNFFAAGGNSIDAARLCRRLRRTLGRRIPLGLVMRHPYPADLAAALTGADAIAGRDDRRDHSDGLPLTAPQERLLLRDAEHRRLGKPPYVRTVAWCGRVGVALDVATLDAALRALVARHDALRTTFDVVDGRGRATVAPSGTAPLDVVDLSAAPDAEDAAVRDAADRVDTPFERARLPRLRATLYRLGSDACVLLIVLDHIVGDGRSVDILARDLAELYTASRADRTTTLPPLPVRFVDWVAAQHSPVGRQHRARLVEHWRDSVRTNRFFPYADLPFARPEPLPATYSGARQRLCLSPSMVGDMERFARDRRTTLFVTHLATLVATLHRLTGEQVVTVVVPDDNRGDPDVEDVVGWFATSMPLRILLPPDPSFEDVVSVAHETLVAALEHRGVSFGEVLDAGADQRQIAPVAVIRLAYADAPEDPPRFDGVPALPISLPFTSAGLGISIWSRRTHDGSGLDVTVVHGLEHFSTEAVGGFLASWQAVATAALGDPVSPLRGPAG